MKDARKRFSVGDINPIEHGGGFCFKRTGDAESWLEYTHGLDALTDGKLLVYRVPVGISPGDLKSSLDWADLDAVATSCGYAESDCPHGNLETAKERAMLIQDVAGYYGWHELDHYPLELTVKELKKRWNV